MADKHNTDHHTGNFRGLTDDEIKTLKSHWNALELSVEYCRPFWDKALRMDKLYHGELPEELDGTMSKVMLRLPMSIVQNESPRKAASLFSSQQFFNLRAANRMLEPHADAATQWLLYHARERNRIFPRVLPTLDRIGIYGTGYRSVLHTPVTEYVDGKKRIRNAIVSENVDFWNVLPSPTGGMVNPLDPGSEEGVDWLHRIKYLSTSQLKALSTKRYANKRMIEKMLASTKRVEGSEGDFNIDAEYREQSKLCMTDDEQSDWMTRLRRSEKEGIDGRWRCIWTFWRDRWVLIGEGQYPLVDSPPLLDWIPLAKYVDTPDMDNWFGTGLIEICEDVLLAFLLNFNMRLDYLATTMNPSKFIRDDIVKMNGGDSTDFDPRPNALYKVNPRIDDIRKAVWYDRFPEISPQAFMEETSFKQLLQEITAQPNYMKGMGGQGTLANETATGIVSLIEEGTARSSMRTINTEYIGLHDELMLMLKWGRKYVWEDQEIRVQGQDGYPWMMIDHEAIDDGYGIELQGARSLIHKNEMVKRMMSVLPILIGNPAVPGQQELIRQTLAELDVFANVDEIVGMRGQQAPPQLTTGAGAGMGGIPTVQNEAQAVRQAGPRPGQGAQPMQRPAGTPASFAV